MFGSDCTNKRFSSESVNAIRTRGQMCRSGQMSRDNGCGAAASEQKCGTGLKCLTGGSEVWRSRESVNKPNFLDIAFFFFALT